MPKTLLWRSEALKSLEYFRFDQGEARQLLEGVVILPVEDAPSLARYTVVCGPDWKTERVSLRLESGREIQEVELAIDAGGHWTSNGNPMPLLDGLIDADIQITPATNTLPIRRLALAVGETRAVTAAWLRFPGLTVEPLEQEYTRLDERRYRYRSLASGFEAELTVDADDLVVRYGDLWARG